MPPHMSLVLAKVFTSSRLLVLVSVKVMWPSPPVHMVDDNTVFHESGDTSVHVFY